MTISSSVVLWLGLTLIVAVDKYLPGAAMVGGIVMIVGIVLALLGR